MMSDKLLYLDRRTASRCQVIELVPKEIYLQGNRIMEGFVDSLKSEDDSKLLLKC